MSTSKWIAVAAVAAVAGVLALTSTGAQKQDTKLAERGSYLVTAMGCNDCHTPLVLGPDGPAPDMSRMLSGHPESLAMPAAPKLPEGPWGVVVSSTLTAWNGPWGTTFASNLTPDIQTGLGAWTVEDFVAALRTGRHMGRGRPILPPMPWQSISKLTDDDLRAVFAYLRTVPAVSNRVGEALPPEGAR